MLNFSSPFPSENKKMLIFKIFHLKACIIANETRNLFQHILGEWMVINWFKRMVAAALGLFLVAGAGSAFAGANPALQDQNMMLEGRLAAFDQPLLNVDGWTYVPVREFVWQMEWFLFYNEQSGHIAVANAIGDKLEFEPGASEVVYNGQKYRIAGTVLVQDDYTYLPMRLLAEAMHAQVGWLPDEELASVNSVSMHVVVAGDTWDTLAQTYQTTPEALRVRNGLAPDDTAALQIGQLVKVVVPEFMVKEPEEKKEEKVEIAEDAVQIDPAELELLAKLVQVEAGYEPYEGKLAVANVVMNRVQSPHFPDTLVDVIYAPNQFPPARNGLLDKTVPSADSIKAARAALSGENNVPGAVYFFNPKVNPGKRSKVTVVKEIGNHVFAK